MSGIRGPGIEVDDDAAVAGDAGVARQFLVGHAADADQRGVTGNDPSVGEMHAGDRPIRALQRLDAGAKFDRYALRAVEVLEEVRQDFAGDTSEDARHEFDDRDLGTQGAGGGGGFQADIASADDGQFFPRSQHGFQLVGIGGGAQFQHIRQLDPRQRNAARARAGGEDQMRVMHRDRRRRMSPCARPGRCW
jgi:hypothetical protein